MRHERVIRCGTSAEARAGSTRLNFTVDGDPAAASLRIDRLSNRLVANLPDRLIDLLEVAAYVYASDAAIRRGGLIGEHLGSDWRRRLSFEIPVRSPELWNDRRVKEPLVETLRLLTEDDYEFSFVPSAAPGERERYFGFLGEGEPEVDAVHLLSGGLDSLAGALDDLVSRGNRAVLVSHHSSTKLQRVQTELVRDLRDRAGTNRLFHVPVDMKMRNGSNRETTHRSRSFFFAAMGATAALMFHVDRVHFYENGVVSLNLPTSGQVVGTLATRSTHPQVLDGFSRLFSAVLDRPVTVSNPFIWKTKTEIVETIRDLGAQGLIRSTRSCAEVRQMTTAHSHCGLCSQCIDRRFAVLAAGMAEEDPGEAYAVDLLQGPRTNVRDREIALGYVRNARFFAAMSPSQFLQRFGEIQRALAYLDQPADAAGERIFRLHQRHGRSVKGVVDEAIADATSRGATFSASGLVMLVGREIFAGNEPKPTVPPSTSAPTETGPSAPGSPAPWVLTLLRDRKRVSIKALGELSGISATVVSDLAKSHLEAAGTGLAPEDYPLRPSRDLASAWTISEYGVRKRISICRRAIAGLANAQGLEAPDENEIVENVAWRGYRLNPDRVRVIVPGQVRSSDKG